MKTSNMIPLAREASRRQVEIDVYLQAALDFVWSMNDATMLPQLLALTKQEERESDELYNKYG